MLAIGPENTNVADPVVATPLKLAAIIGSPALELLSIPITEGAVDGW